MSFERLGCYRFPESLGWGWPSFVSLRIGPPLQRQQHGHRFCIPRFHLDGHSTHFALCSASLLAIPCNIRRRPLSEGCGVERRAEENGAAGAQQRSTNQRPKRQSCRLNDPPCRRTFSAAQSPPPATPAPWPKLIGAWLFTHLTLKRIWSLNTPPRSAPAQRCDAWPDTPSWR